MGNITSDDNQTSIIDNEAVFYWFKEGKLKKRLEQSKSYGKSKIYYSQSSNQEYILRNFNFLDQKLFEQAFDHIQKFRVEHDCVQKVINSLTIYSKQVLENEQVKLFVALEYIEKNLSDLISERFTQGLQFNCIQLIDFLNQMVAGLEFYYVIIKEGSYKVLTPENILQENENYKLSITREVDQFDYRNDLIQNRKQQMFYSCQQKLNLIKEPLHQKQIEQKMNWKKSDIFSLGIITLKMALSFNIESLYDLDNYTIDQNFLATLMENLKNKKYYQEIYFLVKKMVEIDPEKRISFEELKENIQEILLNKQSERSQIKNIQTEGKKYYPDYKIEKEKKNYSTTQKKTNFQIDLNSISPIKNQQLSSQDSKKINSFYNEIQSNYNNSNNSQINSKTNRQFSEKSFATVAKSIVKDSFQQENQFQNQNQNKKQTTNYQSFGIEEKDKNQNVNILDYLNNQKKENFNQDQNQNQLKKQNSSKKIFSDNQVIDYSNQGIFIQRKQKEIQEQSFKNKQKLDYLDEEKEQNQNQNYLNQIKTTVKKQDISKKNSRTSSKQFQQNQFDQKNKQKKFLNESLEDKDYQLRQPNQNYEQNQEILRKELEEISQENKRKQLEQLNQKIKNKSYLKSLHDDPEEDEILYFHQDIKPQFLKQYLQSQGQQITQKQLLNKIVNQGSQNEFKLNQMRLSQINEQKQKNFILIPESSLKDSKITNCDFYDKKYEQFEPPKLVTQFKTNLTPHQFDENQNQYYNEEIAQEKIVYQKNFDNVFQKKKNLTEVDFDEQSEIRFEAQQSRNQSQRFENLQNQNREEKMYHFQQNQNFQQKNIPLKEENFYQYNTKTNNDSSLISMKNYQEKEKKNQNQIEFNKYLQEKYVSSDKDQTSLDQIENQCNKNKFTQGNNKTAYQLNKWFNQTNTNNNLSNQIQSSSSLKTNPFLEKGIALSRIVYEEEIRDFKQKQQFQNQMNQTLQRIDKQLNKLDHNPTKLHSLGNEIHKQQSRRESFNRSISSNEPFKKNIIQQDIKEFKNQISTKSIQNNNSSNLLNPKEFIKTLNFPYNKN